jgi:hypothetical protein
MTTASKRGVLISSLVGLAISGPPAVVQEGRGPMGPLRVHSKNPRYFTDGSGPAVYLTAAHTWASLQDIGFNDPPPAFDYGPRRVSRSAAAVPRSSTLPSAKGMRSFTSRPHSEDHWPNDSSGSMQEKKAPRPAPQRPPGHQ